MISFSRRVLLLAVIATESLGAQRVPADTGSRRDSTVAADSINAAASPRISAADYSPHFDKRLVAGLVLGSLALMPLDRQAESWFQRPSLQSNPALHSSASAFNWIGGTGVLAGSIAALAVGRLTGNDRLSEVRPPHDGSDRREWSDRRSDEGHHRSPVSREGRPDRLLYRSRLR